MILPVSSRTHAECTENLFATKIQDTRRIKAERVFHSSLGLVKPAQIALGHAAASLIDLAFREADPGSYILDKAVLSISYKQNSASQK